MTTPRTKAMPSPRYTRPEIDAENPYWPVKTPLKVVNKRYITPKTKEAYRDRTNTTGERIRSMVGWTKAWARTCRGVKFSVSLDLK